jgi:hypothetical protein
MSDRDRDRRPVRVAELMALQKDHGAPDTRRVEERDQIVSGDNGEAW